MLNTDQPAKADSPTRSVERMAWAMIVLSFLSCVLLGTSATMLGYRWLAQPSSGVVTANVQQRQFAQVQQAGLVQLRLLQAGTLAPGDRVLISGQARPGSAASLQFGTSTIALWAGSDLVIGRFQPRWNDQVAVADFQLNAGMAVIEISGDDEHIDMQFDPRLGGNEVVLTGPGLYRLRILDPESPTTAIAERTYGRGLEITVDRGKAVVGSNVIDSGSRLIEAESQQYALTNTWKFVRDGMFEQYADVVFWKSAPGPPIWSPNSAGVVGAAESGLVIPVQDCRDPIQRLECQQPYLKLKRDGGNTSGFATAVQQDINADVSSYADVRLHAEIQIVSHSLSMAGQTGTECPLLLRLTYSSDTNDTAQQDYCYWSYMYPNQMGAVAQVPYILTQQLAPRQWISIDIDVLQNVPNLRKIRSLSIQANGHDYESYVRNVSIEATGILDIPGSNESR